MYVMKRVVIWRKFSDYLQIEGGVELMTPVTAVTDDTTPYG
jgi:hypothetical protein